MIDVKQLIQVAPFPDESKKQLLEQVDSFSDDKKFELIQTCWELISFEYQNKISLEVQKKTLEMAEGTASYTPEDFKKIEDNIFTELTNKLEAVGSKDKIEEIRQQLQTQTTAQATQQQ